MSVPNPNQKPPSSESIVVPKMENPNPTNQIPIEGEKTETGETEMQLVSSLAKLQKLEAMIHQLRTLLPGRLLEPLVPIVNPRKASPVPKSPQALYEQLSQTATAGVAEVGNFQSMWRDPEMKAIWDHVDSRIRENGGLLLQTTGMWGVDYDVLLEKLVKEEEGRRDQAAREEEEMERSRVQSGEGDWRGVVEEFQKRNVPGVRVLAGEKETGVTVALVKAGMSLHVQAVTGLENGVPDWRVSNKNGATKSKMESAISDCLNSRPRQWDLSYLLEMISSYSAIKQTPCLKCAKMTDNTAQLPTIRKPVQSQSQPRTWEAYHPSCI